MTCRGQRGFSYVEVLVAVALLTLCALPAADAIKNGLDAATAGETKARELRCMKNKMETVLAEPFDNLWKAARDNAVPSSYSQAADADNTCGERKVFIAKYVHMYNTAGKVLPDGDPTEDTLLQITVGSPDDTSFVFTTLVDR